MNISVAKFKQPIPWINTVDLSSSALVLSAHNASQGSDHWTLVNINTPCVFKALGFSWLIFHLQLF